MAYVHPLAFADEARCAAGRWLDLLGLGPRSAPSRLVHASSAFELLGDPAAPSAGRTVLLVPAPIKQAYIWDLAPEVSVVRRCRARGFAVYLLRWLPPRAGLRPGLADYADRMIAEAVRVVEAHYPGRPVVLVGHSLGGTLAAIFASLNPERVRGLTLLEAPLRFGVTGAGALAALARPSSARPSTVAQPVVPGTLLSVGAVTMAPEPFFPERWADRIVSSVDADALLLHQRVERWALDELPMSGRLFDELVESLYRRDGFMRGELTIHGRRAAPTALTAPILAVLDVQSTLVPPTSVLPFLAATRSVRKVVLEYERETGVALQHVGALVGRHAHRRLWPRILDWIEALS